MLLKDTEKVVNTATSLPQANSSAHSDSEVTQENSIIIPIPVGVHYDEAATLQANEGQGVNALIWNREKNQLEVDWKAMEKQELQLFFVAETAGRYTFFASKLQGSSWVKSEALTISVTAEEKATDSVKAVKKLNLLENKVDNTISDSANPVATNSVEVKTWAEFKVAFDDVSVDKIILKQDINYVASGTGNGQVTPLTRSLEIEGSKNNPDPNASYGERYYELNMLGSRIRLGKITSADSRPVIHAHDIIVENNGDNLAGNQGSVFSAEQYTPPTNGAQSSNRWTYRFGNIVIPKGKTSRLATATRGEVTFYGDVNLITRSENVYVGSMIIEDGTTYYGENIETNYSVIWFKNQQQSGDTGEAGKFEVGKNALVQLKNTRSGAAGYPAVYS